MNIRQALIDYRQAVERRDLTAELRIAGEIVRAWDDLRTQAAGDAAGLKEALAILAEKRGAA